MTSATNKRENQRSLVSNKEQELKSQAYSHLTIKLHTILCTLYSFLHFKQTLNAKSLQYDANIKHNTTRHGTTEQRNQILQMERERVAHILNTNAC